MGPWIQTYTGKKFHILEPVPDEFDIEDVAHALSLQCRFNGHCNRFYSVAEHSVRVSRLCTANEEACKWGLLHDLAEAYVGDCVRPLKQVMPEYREIEQRIVVAAAKAFGLSLPIPDEVLYADEIMLATEARDLMAEAPDRWKVSAEPLEERIRNTMSAQEVEYAFLQEYRSCKQERPI